MENSTRKSIVTKSKTAKFDQKALAHLEIVERIKSGDQKAFDKLHKEYYNYFFYHCLLSVKNRQIAEDLTMEILTKIYVNIDKYTVNYTFNTWVWSIARNHVIDYIRMSSREPVNINRNSFISSTDHIEDEVKFRDAIKPDDIKNACSSTDDYVQASKTEKLRKQFVDSLLNGVSEKERNILIHYYVDEMSYEQIAKKLNIGLSSMKLTLMRVKNKLRNKIGTMDKISHLLAS
ncbi:MAG: hypothetical protein RLZ10_199 [Bacteroidota bacterium]|jgi:RNA polymerase sigma-70 factor (ECF subfamily)